MTRKAAAAVGPDHLLLLHALREMEEEEEEEEEAQVLERKREIKSNMLE